MFVISIWSQIAMVSAHSGWLSKTQFLWNWLQMKHLIPVSRHNLISPFRVIIMSSKCSAFSSFPFCFFGSEWTQSFFLASQCTFPKGEDGVWGILPHNTLINRLLIATIYINEERIPLVRIPKYPTTLLNLHQPTSVWIDFFFVILMVKYVTVLVNTPKPSAGLRGRQFLRTISGVYSVSSVRPVVRRDALHCVPLASPTIPLIFIIPFPSDVFFFSGPTPPSISISRWDNKRSTGAWHTLPVGCLEWLSEILKGTCFAGKECYRGELVSSRLRRDGTANRTALLIGPHGGMNVALSDLTSLKAEW